LCLHDGLANRLSFSFESTLPSAFLKAAVIAAAIAQIGKGATLARQPTSLSPSSFEGQTHKLPPINFAAVAGLLTMTGAPIIALRRNALE